MVENNPKKLFDWSFLQNFSFSPSLTINNLYNDSSWDIIRSSSSALVEPLIPVDHLIYMFNAQDKACISPTLPLNNMNHNNVPTKISSANIPDKNK